MSALQQHYAYYADAYKNDLTYRKTLFEALKVSPDIYFTLNEDLRNDRGILEAALEQRSECYLFASTELRSDVEIYFQALRGGAQDVTDLTDFLECWREAVPVEFQNSVEIQSKAIAINFSSITHASDRVRSTPSYVVRVAEAESVAFMGDHLIGDLRARAIANNEAGDEYVSEEAAQTLYDELKAQLQKEKLQSEAPFAGLSSKGQFKL